jgi:hypothetical protein
MHPNFLIVGAEKAGTTTLAGMLAQHPETFMCNPKEPRFFTYHNWDRGLHWYESLFDGAVGYKAVGEASPAYTWAPESIDAPKRIYQCLGDIRYLYIVRHPIKRMISHYRHALFHRWIPDHTSFEAALKLIPGLKNCSYYFYQIEQYLTYTRREQWHIVVLEELIKDHQNVMMEIFRFLEIDETSSTQLRAENVTDKKRRPRMLYEHLRQLRPLQHYLPASFERLVIHFKHKLGEKIEKPDISENAGNALMEELKPDIQRLSDFCGKDLKAIWRID